MKRVLCIAPHPDDETLGCGGTLLRHKAEGDELFWLIITNGSVDTGYSEDFIKQREQEIQRVSAQYGFAEVHKLNFPPRLLDTIPLSELIEGVSQSFHQIRPQIIYLPYSGDIHTDHRIVFDATAPCTKWFRYSSIKRVLAYETLSETDFNINPESNGFRANVFVNITPYLAKKLEIMGIYASETGEFPFPRSKDALEMLAGLRGVASGYEAAEGFMLLKEQY